MAVIIGRKQEQKELSRLYHSDEAEMVVVYGRRRRIKEESKEESKGQDK